jgi:hypothetical protein
MVTVMQHVVVDDGDRGSRRRNMELLGNTVAMPDFWEKGEEVDVGVESPCYINEQVRIPT